MALEDYQNYRLDLPLISQNFRVITSLEKKNNINLNSKLGSQVYQVSYYVN